LCVKDPDDGGAALTCYASTIEGRYGSLLKLFFKLFFSRISMVPEQAQRIRDLASKGRVVYVLKSRSDLESILYHYQSVRYGLPVPVFACDSNMTMFHSLGLVLRILGGKIRRIGQGRMCQDPYLNGYIRELLRTGKPLIVYLQDMEAFARRFLRSGRDPVVHILEVQRDESQPIFMVPLMVIWDREQERNELRLDEVILGQRSNPSAVRVFFNFFRFYRKDSYISMAEPLNVRAFTDTHPKEDLQALSIELREELLERLRAEKRIVTGPMARSRQEIMERVLFDERVQQAINRRLKRKGKSPKMVRKEAYRIVREIAADIDPLFLRVWDWAMKWFLRALYEGLEVDRGGLERLREAARTSNLVLVPCHKSHMDYLVLAYVFYHNYLFPPLIAAGLNLAFWPMGFIFRKSGAFFIRRTFRGSVLYPAIFTRYIRLLLEEGYPLEFFIEGGRSRSGKMVLPKLGFLSMLIDGYKAGSCEDISFVPTAITYERVWEEAAYLREVEGGEKRRETFWGMLRSRHVFRKRYGKIHINFNEPVSLKRFLERTTKNPSSYMQYTRQNIPFYLARELAQKINQVLVVVPTTIVASALLSSPLRAFSYGEVLRTVQLFYGVLEDEEARFSSSLADQDQLPSVLRETLDFFLKERLIYPVRIEQEESDDEAQLYEIHDKSRRRLDYYKNSILHYLLPQVFVSLSLLAKGAVAVPFDQIMEDSSFLRELFQQEFVFLPEEDLEDRIRLILDGMVQKNLLRKTAGGFSISASRRQDHLRLSRMIQSYFESYYVVGSSLKYIAERRLSQMRFLWRVRLTAHRFYHTGRIQLPESISQINFNNAIQYLVDQKIILRQVDKTFREGTYYRLIRERRKVHWRRVKMFLRVYG
jgi:glycerol-3-phosphate O-acyltransferase